MPILLVSHKLTGCENTKSDEQLLENEKAAKVALEYMNSKYNKEFYLVSSKKDAEHGMYEKETV